MCAEINEQLVCYINFKDNDSRESIISHDQTVHSSDERGNYIIIMC